MNESNLKTEYYIKHILSPEWIPAKYISSKGNHIEFLIEDTDGVSFEKDDKIVYFVKSKHNNSTHNTVIHDIDFPTYNKITVTLEKPLERRLYSRFNVNLLSTVNKKQFSSECSIVDISKKGMKILTDSSFALHDYLEVIVPLNNDDIITAKCKVIYKAFNSDYLDSRKFAYGLKIVNISNLDNKLLNDFIDSLK